MSNATRSAPVTEAVAALLLKQPFFASLMLDMLEIVETDTAPVDKNALATDGHTMWINPKRFAEFNVAERVGCLAHEVMHTILQHPARSRMYQQLGMGPDFKPFQPLRFNKAADYVINAYLVSQGLKLPLGSLQNSQVTGDDIVDEVYAKLPPEDDEDEDDGSDTGNFDGHQPPTNGSNPTSKPAIQAAVKKAQELAKMQGHGSAGMNRLVDEICEPQVSWQEHLRKTFTTVTRGNDAYTWSKPNRRKLAVPPHIYWPGRAGFKGPQIGIEIDTSGSIGDQELSVFLAEMSAILSDIQPEMVHVMFVDSELFNNEVIEIDDVNNIHELKQKAGGGGGTDMTKVFEIIEQRQLPIETVVIFTDGYTPYGEDTGIPTIWCMTTDQVAPWGTTVHVKIPRN